MPYYIFLEDGTINGAGEVRQIDEGVENIEVSEDIYNSFIENPDKYIYLDGEIIENPNYEIEQVRIERERLDMLSLTAADVERAIYKAKGMDFEDILELVKTNPDIDIKALKIELKANNFYRGNPYINQVGALLGYTSDDLDYLFVNKSLPLVNNPEQTNEGNSDVEPIIDDVIVNNENNEGKY